jgi:hypothetical protein
MLKNNRNKINLIKHSAFKNLTTCDTPSFTSPLYFGLERQAFLTSHKIWFKRIPAVSYRTTLSCKALSTKLCTNNSRFFMSNRKKSVLPAQNHLKTSEKSEMNISTNHQADCEKAQENTQRFEKTEQTTKKNDNHQETSINYSDAFGIIRIFGLPSLSALSFMIILNNMQNLSVEASEKKQSKQYCELEGKLKRKLKDQYQKLSRDSYIPLSISHDLLYQTKSNKTIEATIKKAFEEDVQRTPFHQWLTSYLNNLSNKHLTIPEIVEALEVKNDTCPNNIVGVVGGCGVGKSTFCQYLASRWSLNASELKYDFVFCFDLKAISDSDIERSKDLFELIDIYFFPEQTEELKSSTFINRKNCKILFIFDEFDKIKQPSKDKIVKLINSFISKSSNSFILSSREHNLPSGLNYQHKLVLSGFSEASVNSYIRTFYCNDPKAEELIKIVSKNISANKLARIPYFLKAICLEHKDNKLTNQSIFSKSKLFSLALERVVSPVEARDEKLQQLAKFVFDSVTNVKELKHQASFSHALPNDDILRDFLIAYYISTALDEKNTRRLSDLIKLSKEGRLNDEELKELRKLEDHYKKSVEFIRANKYSPKYQHVWTYVAGSLSLLGEPIESFFRYFDNVEINQSCCLEMLSAMPSDPKPNSYLLITNNQVGWKLFYIDNATKTMEVDIDQVPGLEETLRTLPSTPPEMFLDHEKKVVENAVISYQNSIDKVDLLGIYEKIVIMSCLDEAICVHPHSSHTKVLRTLAEWLEATLDNPTARLWLRHFSLKKILGESISIIQDAQINSVFIKILEEKTTNNNLEKKIDTIKLIGELNFNSSAVYQKLSQIIKDRKEPEIIRAQATLSLLEITDLLANEIRELSNTLIDQLGDEKENFIQRVIAAAGLSKLLACNHHSTISNHITSQMINYLNSEDAVKKVAAIYILQNHSGFNTTIIANNNDLEREFAVESKIINKRLRKILLNKNRREDDWIRFYSAYALGKFGELDEKSKDAYSSLANANENVFFGVKVFKEFFRNKSNVINLIRYFNTLDEKLLQQIDLIIHFLDTLIGEEKNQALLLTDESDKHLNDTIVDVRYKIQNCLKYIKLLRVFKIPSFLFRIYDWLGVQPEQIEQLFDMLDQFKGQKDSIKKSYTELKNYAGAEIKQDNVDEIIKESENLFNIIQTKSTDLLTSFAFTFRLIGIINQLDNINNPDILYTLLHDFINSTNDFTDNLYNQIIEKTHRELHAFGDATELIKSVQSFQENNPELRKIRFSNTIKTIVDLLKKESNQHLLRDILTLAKENTKDVLFNLIYHPAFVGLESCNSKVLIEQCDELIKSEPNTEKAKDKVRVPLCLLSKRFLATGLPLFEHNLNLIFYNSFNEERVAFSNQRCKETFLEDLAEVMQEQLGSEILSHFDLYEDPTTELRTAFYLAENNFELMRERLEELVKNCGIEILNNQKNGETLLMLAINYDNLKLVNYLLGKDKQAEVNIVNLNYQSALEIAANLINTPDHPQAYDILCSLLKKYKPIKMSTLNKLLEHFKEDYDVDVSASRRNINIGFLSKLAAKLAADKKCENMGEKEKTQMMVAKKGLHTDGKVVANNINPELLLPIKIAILLKFWVEIEKEKVSMTTVLPGWEKLDATNYLKDEIRIAVETLRVWNNIRLINKIEPVSSFGLLQNPLNDNLIKQLALHVKAGILSKDPGEEYVCGTGWITSPSYFILLPLFILRNCCNANAQPRHCFFVVFKRLEGDKSSLFEVRIDNLGDSAEIDHEFSRDKEGKKLVKPFIVGIFSKGDINTGKLDNYIIDILKAREQLYYFIHDKIYTKKWQESLVFYQHTPEYDGFEKQSSDYNCGYAGYQVGMFYRNHHATDTVQQESMYSNLYSREDNIDTPWIRNRRC